jgi:hypothetical protein
MNILEIGGLIVALTFAFTAGGLAWLWWPRIRAWLHRGPGLAQMPPMPGPPGDYVPDEWVAEYNAYQKKRGRP